MEAGDLREALQGQVLVQAKGYLRYWQIYSVSIPNRTLTLPKKSYTISSLNLDVEGLKAPGAASRPVRDLRLGAEWGFASILGQLVHNTGDLQDAAVASPPASPALEMTNWSPSTLPKGKAVFAFSTSDEEFVQILPEHFQKAGLDPGSVDPGSIRLFSRGTPVPLFRNDNGDAAFSPGEWLLFHGHRSESPFSTDRAYWLVVGATAMEGAPEPLKDTDGPTPPEVNVRPWYLAQEKLEQDEFSVHEEGNFLEIGEVKWVWKALTADEVTSVTFALPGLDPSAEDAPQTVDLSLSLFHLSEYSENLPPNTLPISQRKVLATLNGESVGEITFTDHMDRLKTLPVPLSLLKDSGNDLRLEMTPLDPNLAGSDTSAGTYLDSVSFSYPAPLSLREGKLRMQLAASDQGTTQGWTLNFPAKNLLAFDVTDPEMPKEIVLTHTGEIPVISPPSPESSTLELMESDGLTSSPLLRAWKSSGIRHASNEADYLVITHPRFATVIQPLLDLKKSQGLQVRTVFVQDIYDEFSNGELSPEGLKRFLFYTLRTWKVPPTYVLFVGDSTGDYRNELRVDVVNLVPSYRNQALVSTNESWASDHWFSTLVGDDDFPDILLGRISAVTPEDVAEAIRKQVAADTTLPMGPWRNRFMFIADNDSEFTSACDEMRRDSVPREFFTRRIYLSRMPWERNFYLDQDAVDAENLKVSGATTQAILDSLNLGQAFVSFWGHGAPNIWTDERIWFGMDSPNSDNLLLRNALRMPFITNFSCNTGAIDYPKPPYNICISEDFMRVKEGGARAAYVPTGPGSTSDHLGFSRDIFPALLDGRIRRQGDALALGKVRYMLGDMSNTDYPRMYVLLGDPAQQLPLPQEECTISLRPEWIDLREKRTAVTVTLDKVPFTNGNIVFQFESDDPALEDFPETKPLPFDANTRSFNLELPRGLKFGKWWLKAYAWDEASRKDASGAVMFFADIPHAEIAQMHVDGIDNAKARLTLVLENPSLLPLEGLQFGVSRLNAGQFVRIGGDTIDLAAGEQETWTMEIDAPAGQLLEVRAELGNFTLSSDPEKPNPIRREMAWANPDKTQPPRFALSELEVERQFRGVDLETTAEISLPVFSLGAEYNQPLEMGWGWGEDIASTGTVQMAVGQSRSEFSFSLSTPKDSLPKPFLIEVDPSRKVMKQGPPVRLYQTLDIRALPDLQFVRNGLVVDPPNPSDAHTIWFRLKVRNGGKMDAERFVVTAFNDDPTSGGAELVNAVGNSGAEVRGLVAGGETEAVIRWDAKANAGTNKIYFKIDTHDHVMEINEKNNVGTKTLQVRTLAKLEPVGFEFDLVELMKFQKVRVKASVRNSGETEARNVMIAFFSDREADPRNKMGERFVQRIGPGETHVETYEWAMPQDFRKMVEEALAANLPPDKIRIDACAQVYLRGSLQRVMLAPYSATRTE